MRKPNRVSTLSRMLAPVGKSLNVQASRRLLRIKADLETQARVDHLARKCNDGELSALERREYERLVAAGNVIAILQAEARSRLAENQC